MFKASSSNLFFLSPFQVIKDFFPSILAVAQTFLCSAHPAIVSFGSCMYKQAFAAFDSYCQQVQCGGGQPLNLCLAFVLDCMPSSFRGRGFVAVGNLWREVCAVRVGQAEDGEQSQRLLGGEGSKQAGLRSDRTEKILREQK